MCLSEMKHVHLMTLLMFLKEISAHTSSVYMHTTKSMLSLSWRKLDKPARNLKLLWCHVWRLSYADLKDEIWYQLNINRVYTKKRGVKPSFDDPLIVRNGSTIQDVCSHIHKDFSLKFKYAMVWGPRQNTLLKNVGWLHSLLMTRMLFLFTK